MKLLSGKQINILYITRRQFAFTFTTHSGGQRKQVDGVPFSHLFTELQISPIEVHIYPIEVHISPIQLQIPPNQLQISPIQLKISTHIPI